MSYASTQEIESNKDKCHEEIKWEDFKREDKGTHNKIHLSKLDAPTNPFGPTSTNPTNTFRRTIASNPTQNNFNLSFCEINLSKHIRTKPLMLNQQFLVIETHVSDHTQ
ncbi:hypothetical protein YC2023_095388 [Brassica napus]